MDEQIAFWAVPGFMVLVLVEVAVGHARLRDGHGLDGSHRMDARRRLPRSPGLDPGIPAALRGYCFAQLLGVAAASVHLGAARARVDWRLTALEALGVLVAGVAVGGLLRGKREFVLLEVLRLSGTAFVLVALWTHGSFGVREPLRLAGLLAPLLASMVALVLVANRWFVPDELDGD